MKRIFIAVPVPHAICEDLFELSHQIPGARNVQSENFHITLHFLGNIQEEQLFDLADRLGAINPASFSIKIEGIGRFASKHNDVIWAAVDAPALEGLYQRLGRILDELCIFREKKKWKPHVTLGRLKNKISEERLREFMECAYDYSASFSFPGFGLYSSVLRPSGAEHTQEAFIEAAVG